MNDARWNRSWSKSCKNSTISPSPSDSATGGLDNILYLPDGYNANSDDDSGRGKNHFEGYMAVRRTSDKCYLSISYVTVMAAFSSIL